MYSTTGLDASNFVSTFNTAFYFIVGVSLFLLVGLTIIMILFVIRYRKSKNKVPTQIEGSTKLEIIWTVIPTLLALTMFYFGWAGWKPMTKPPKDGIDITSTARMWSFSFEYGNGKQSNDLIIPVDTNVKIKLVSLDVIHSLFIPAFRIKSDMVPGREKEMWFRAENVGDYDLFCAEYCGLQHSYMTSSVKVLSKEDFEKWYGTADSLLFAEVAASPADEGLAILKSQGCNACHSSDGSKIVGPSYLGLFGSQQVVIRDGKEVTVTADEDYIKRAIYDPNIEVVKGFPTGMMQSYETTITQADLEKIIEYLKSLGSN